MLAGFGLSESVTDAARKLKAGAVEIDGRIHKELLLPHADGTLVLRLGKMETRSCVDLILAPRLGISWLRVYPEHKENHGHCSF